MGLISEFILDGCQYQKRTAGCRRREVDRKGNALSEWEDIHENDYHAIYKINEKRFRSNNNKGDVEQMTVKELINILEQMDEDAKIQVAGGFAEYGTTEVEVVQVGDKVLIQEP